MIIELQNTSPYTAKIYPAVATQLPITWFCVVKASFNFNKQGHFSLLNPCADIHEYDSYNQTTTHKTLHYSHETMQAKVGSEYVILWHHENHKCTHSSKCNTTTNNQTKKLHVLCKQGHHSSHISHSKLWRFSYLAPDHPTRIKALRTKTHNLNVAPTTQRMPYTFNGHESLSWWWGYHAHTTTLNIPKMPLILKIQFDKFTHQKVLLWDTLCIVMDLNQCHLMGRVSFPCNLLQTNHRSIRLECMH